MPALQAVTGPTAGVRYNVAAEAVIGRSPSCEVPILDSKVSRKHARLFEQSGRYVVEDLSSRNGTLVNGERIATPRPLRSGDRVQVGDSTFVFEGEAESVAVEAAQVTHAAAKAVKDPERLAELLGAAAEICSAPDGAVALRRGAEAAARLLKGDRGAVHLPMPAGLALAAGSPLVGLPRAAADAAMRGEAAMTQGIAVAPIVAAGGVGSPGGVLGIVACERAAPFELEDSDLLAALGTLLGAALAAEAARPDEDELTTFHASRGIERVIQAVERAAGTGAPVTFAGEPGCGRATLARYLHARSVRRFGPFVKVRCSRSNAGELFGAEQPFRRGALERADGGTLLLEDVHLLPMSLQARLEGALASRAFTRDGGQHAVGADVRVAATTSSELQDLAEAGRFDRGLARRIAGARIEVPTLRARKADIPALAERFLELRRSELGRPSVVLSPDARSALAEYPWPGNLVELDAACARVAVTVAERTTVGVGDLPVEVKSGGAAAGDAPLADQVARLEKTAVAEALRRARGKKIRAAAILGISRPTLDKKIALYALTVKGDEPGS